MFDGPGGRTDLRRLVEWLGEEKHLSLLIEAGSMLNWAALDSGIVDKVFFYYAPKILGGHGVAADGRRNGTAAAHGRHCASRHSGAPHSRG